MADGYFYSFGKLDFIRGEKGSGCILCKIIRNDPDVSNLTVHTDDLVTVSLNLYPYNPGHLLVFPNGHVLDIRTLSEAQERRMQALIKYFMDILESLYRPEGYNVGYNMGRVSGASIEHLHQHIIPRYPYEVGLADLIGGKRVLIEDPRRTMEKMKAAIDQRPFSISIT